MFQSLDRLIVSFGSRLSIVSIVTLSIFVAESCRNDATCAFEGDDGCGAGGGSAGGSGVFCGETECPATACMTNIRCSENGLECTGDKLDGIEDYNACTVDICDPATGEIQHQPYTTEDIDDGDECTADYCWMTEGIVHQDICGGA